MSAYDNPTIIKDDSAMIYAQTLGTLGQTFTESFNVARKEREAKEKEARLEAEKKEKESKEVQLNKQIYASNTIKQLNAEAEQSRADLAKAGVPPPITDQSINFLLKIKNIIGENEEKIKFDVVDKTFIENNAKLQGAYNNIEANMKRIFGEGGSQIKDGVEGLLNQTNVSNREFRGRTNAQRLREFATYNSSVLNKDIIPLLDYDENDLSKVVKIDIKTTGYDENKLKNAMNTIDPNVTSSNENWQAFIKEAASEGILEEKTGADNKKNYTIIYNKPIDAKTKGDFFVTVPDAMKATDLETSGIYDNKGVLYDSFLGSVNYITAENNAGLKKSEYEAKVESRAVKMDDMMGLIEKKVNTNITGMLSVDFTDLDKLRGFMTSLGMGTDPKMVDKFLENDLATQIRILSEPIIKKYKTQIMKDNNIIQTQDKLGKDIYAQVDRADITKFTVPDKTSGGITESDKKAAIIANKTKIAKDKIEGAGTLPVESPDGTSRIRQYKGEWIKENKSGGNWIIDNAYPAKKTKKEAAEYIGL